jgi:hypothetical protein
VVGLLEHDTCRVEEVDKQSDQKMVSIQGLHINVQDKAPLMLPLVSKTG